MTFSKLIAPGGKHPRAATAENNGSDISSCFIVPLIVG